MEILFNSILQDLKVGLVLIFMCCIFTVAATFFDMWTAIEAVKAQGKKPESHPMSRTGKKIIDYLRLIAYVLMIDILGLFCLSFYNLPYCAVIITLGILAREGLSMHENYRLKKSNAVEAVDLAEKIVQCVASDDAKKIIKLIQEQKPKHRS